MRLRRRILRIILFLLAVPVILCGALYGFHKISLWAESRKYPPVGKMVEVNGHQMHVYGRDCDDKIRLKLQFSGC